MRRFILVAALFAIIQPVYGQEKAPQSKSDQNNSSHIGDQAPAPPSTVINTIKNETTDQQSYGAKNEPESYFHRLVAPENIANLGLLIAGIVGICVAVKTLRSINRQVGLQHAGMQQWIDIEAWTTAFYNEQRQIEVTFKIVNPTNFPITINTFEFTFGLPGFTPCHPLADDFMLSPNGPQTVHVLFPVTEEERVKFRNSGGITVGVRMIGRHSDTGPNGATWMLLEGNLNGQHGVGKATFVQTLKRTWKANKKRQNPN